MKTFGLASVLVLGLAVPARAATPGETKTPAKPAAAAAKPATPATPPKDDLEPEEDDAKSAAEQQPAAGAQPATPGGPKKKVLVLPYQAIFRSVPQAKIDIATNFLQKELKQKDTLEIVRGAVSTEAGKGPSLEGAQAAAQAAQAAEKQKNIGVAVAEWKKAVAAYEANASALEDFSVYVKAYHELARTLMVAGLDAEAKAALDVIVRMDPGYEPEKAQYSRLYRKWAYDAASRATAEPRGEVMVKSALPGAAIELDGRSMDVAPVILEDVVPGKHLVTAQIEGAPAFATFVTVAAGKQVEVAAAFSGTAGGSDVGRVTDAIAQNAIPNTAVESAAAAGKHAGAEAVVFGAMAKDDDKFRVHTFVVDVPSGKIAKLDEMSFDLEMLTAESDVLRIAQAANATISNFKSGEKQIGTIEKRIRGTQSTVNRVNAAPQKGGAGKAAKGGPKKPAKREVFKPLKGGKIEIKDEEKGEE